MDIAARVEELIRGGATLSAGAESALDAILEATGTTSGTIHLIRQPGGMLELLASRDIPPVVIEKIRMIPVGKGMAGVAVEQVKPVTTCNLQTDDAGGIIRQGARATGAQGAVAIPLILDQVAVGALGVATKEARDFSRGEIDTLLDIGRALAAAAKAKA